MTVTTPTPHFSTRFFLSPLPRSVFHIEGKMKRPFSFATLPIFYSSTYKMGKAMVKNEDLSPF